MPFIFPRTAFLITELYSGDNPILGLTQALQQSVGVLALSPACLSEDK